MEAYRARWLLPVTSDPIENGILAVDQGRIVQIGRADTKIHSQYSCGTAVPAVETQAGRLCHSLEISSKCGVPIRDLGDCILLPGLVNAHTHLEMSCYHGRVPPGPLWEWYDQLMPLRLLPGAVEEERRAVGQGAAESLAAGVTCIGDISRTGIQVEALRSSPIRKVCFLELISGAQLPPNDLESLARGLDSAEQFARPCQLMPGISPHTLYTVTWEDLVGVGKLAADRGVPITIHVLETAEEAQWLAGDGDFVDALLERHGLPTATMAVQGGAMSRLRRAGLLALRPLLAHVNYIDDRELDELAASGAGVVWCPRSHRYFGHRPHRWRDMLAAGIPVCIGTDSLASNQSLSILDELRFMHRSTPAVPPGEILKMGTIGGAAGLGVDPHIGSLEPGKLGDFVTVPWDPSGHGDPLRNLLDGDLPASGTWIDGRDVPLRTS